MRNVIHQVLAVSLLAVSFGCSSESDGISKVAPGDADVPRRGAIVSGGEQAVTAPDAQPRASQDAQSPDSVVVAPDTMPDAEPMKLDTTEPEFPPVKWEPGAASTDPALAVCPPTKGNSLGIGKACSNAPGGARCPEGTGCLCGGEMMADLTTFMVPKTMPCMCVASMAGGPNVASDCPSCGAGAGCCALRNSIESFWVCLPNSCADSYCRPYTAGAR